MRPAEGLSPIQHSEFEIFTGADVRFGSKADILVVSHHVRFTPKSGYSAARAKSGHCSAG
jgi:hypothetical protein